MGRLALIAIGMSVLSFSAWVAVSGNGRVSLDEAPSRDPVPGRPSSGSSEPIKSMVGSSAEESPRARWAHALVYDSRLGEVVLCGGTGFKPQGLAAFGDVWVRRGQRWSLVVSGDPPMYSAYVDHAAAYDPVRLCVVRLGGWPDERSDPWDWGAFSGREWRETKSGSVSPAARWSTAMVTDEKRNRIVLFGGQSEDVPYLADTWEWDGTAWSKCRTSRAPPARHAHAMAYDSLRNRVVLFGGLGPGESSNRLLQDTWEWDGVEWTQRRIDQAPPGRCSHAMTFDAVRTRVVLFGGLGRRIPGDPKSKIALADTWEWDGQQWAQKVTNIHPSPRWGCDMVFDKKLSHTVMFGGHSGIQQFADTWEWNGGRWVEIVGPVK
jgi:Galactose oxidase, central domain